MSQDQPPHPLQADSGDKCCVHGIWLTPEGRCPLCDGDQPMPKRVARVCLFTDLIGSTDLKQRLGDITAGQAIQRHNEFFRDLLAQYGGREANNLGDGFFALFDLPSSALTFALAFQTGLAALDVPEPLHARVGINMGEIPEPGQAEMDSSMLLSSEIDAAARVMGLSEAAQILMTRAAFDLARPVLTTGPRGERLTWKAHGAYVLKGLDGTREIFEVGIQGTSPLRPPRGSDKAQRVADGGQAETPGWRPAVGLDVPGRPGWRIEKKLGVGGFGEVWLGVQPELRQRRAFKFCFEAERLRMLRREVKILKVLAETLGDRDDIAKVLEWHVQEPPPYYLESEFAGEGSLLDWAQRQGGLAAIPMAIRLEIIAQTADALAAAHSVGVLHRDIKPSNILITITADQPRVRLADFGIGAILNVDLIKRIGLTSGGFTTDLGRKTGSDSGTYAYLEPEVIGGSAPTVKSDIFSLGVVLYQTVLGDFTAVLGPGWEQTVGDELLREDIFSCVRVRETRIETAGQLSRALRSIDRRRRERERVQRQAAEAKARQHRRQQFRYWGAVTSAFLAVLALFYSSQ